MNITPSDLVLYGGLILTILNILDRSAIIKEKAESPHKEMAKKVEDLEHHVEEIEARLKNDNWRIEQLEDGVRVLLESMGALLSHSIDGNNMEEMKSAKKKLNEYLIGR